MRTSFHLTLAAGLLAAAFGSVAATTDDQRFLQIDDCSNGEGYHIAKKPVEAASTACGGVTDNAGLGLLLATTTDYTFDETISVAKGDVLTGQIVLETFFGPPQPTLSASTITVTLLKGETVIATATVDATSTGEEFVIAPFEMTAGAAASGKDAIFRVDLEGANLMSAFVSHAQSVLVLP